MCPLHFGDGTSERSGRRLGGNGGGKGADMRVDEVFWQEDIVGYTCAIIFFAGALVDTPIAIDDKLRIEQLVSLAPRQTLWDSKHQPCIVYGPWATRPSS